MLYAAVKHLHIACVVLSITGFCLRGLLIWQKSALVERRWFRILPHVNDSILLAAALTLTVLIGQYPFVDAWLTTKVLGLLAYISLGMLALKAGRSPRVRVVAGLAAVAVFIWIVSVAFTKNPLGLLA
ncbi:MAG: SirB2 family protein [Rhodocyclaceae bacterium]|nr:SirB2 family protein [Rhodocyclaceae bacterium]MDP1957960.1 SirB2 family protein [Rhodocyclaceae bacterium]